MWKLRRWRKSRGTIVIEPTWQTDDGRVQLYLGDNREILPQLPNVDAVVTSPPYDDLRTYENPELVWREAVWSVVIEGLGSCVRTGGVVVWVVGDATVGGSETGTSFKQAIRFMETGFLLHDTMIYQKLNGGANGSNRAYLQSFEYMFILSNHQPPTVTNLIYDRKNVAPAGRKAERPGRRHKTGETKAVRVVTRTAMGRRFNIWPYFVGQNRAGHPAEFPMGLASDHIRTWCNVGDTILDPFMGSGTTGIACIRLGRKFIGIEISEKYFEIAKKRIQTELAQGDFFRNTDMAKIKDLKGE